MNRGEKILTGAVALSVAGLILLTLPAIGPLFASAAPTAPVPTATDLALTAPAASSGSDTSVDDASTMSAADDVEYQDIGGGVSIPAKGPGQCSSWAAIHPYGAGDPSARLGGTITDLGPTNLASGEVGFDAEGQVATYTVAAGDTGVGIGERLCVDYITVLAYNGVFASGEDIHPGDVLILRP